MGTLMETEMVKTVKNIDKVLKQFKQFGKEAEKMVEETTSSNAKEIVRNAKANVTRVAFNNGKLAQSIYDDKNTYANYSIKVGLEYGAYVEFGTGKQVRVPKELQDQANKFKGKGGNFEQGLQSIKDWCKNKGIDEKFAYPIFMAILRDGLTPRPFLYPAFRKGRIQYLKDLESDLEHLTKKYND